VKLAFLSLIAWNLTVSDALRQDQVAIMIRTPTPSIESVVVYGYLWENSDSVEFSVIGRDWPSQMWPDKGYYVVAEEPEDSLVCYFYQEEYVDGSASVPSPESCLFTGTCH